MSAERIVSDARLELLDMTAFLIEAEKRGLEVYAKGRAAELLAANNREVERRRAAEAALIKGQPGQYLHLKSNGLYQVLCHATVEQTAEPGYVQHTFDGKPPQWGPQTVVVYRNVATNQVWTRPANEFYDGRFKYLP